MLRAGGVMKVMVLEQPGQALQLVHYPVPQPGPGQVLIAVEACGVCRTDLHLVDGELPNMVLPLTPGHEVVGRVAALGSAVDRWRIGQRVGLPWLGWTCGTCTQCLSGHENLCPKALFTGYQIPGGFAEFTLADQRYCYELPLGPSPEELAPLLCAGLIGYRAWRQAGPAKRLGVYGFGAAGHLVTQLVRRRGCAVYALTRPGDVKGQAFARSLGVVWAGGSDETPPDPLDAVLIFAPDGRLVPTALQHIRLGGCVVCAGIHMSEIPSFPYAWLWGERVLRSVANLTRRDGNEFFELVAQAPLKAQVQVFSLEEANLALDLMRRGDIQGAAVLSMRLLPT